MNVWETKKDPQQLEKSSFLFFSLPQKGSFVWVHKSPRERTSFKGPKSLLRISILVKLVHWFEPSTSRLHSFSTTDLVFVFNVQFLNLSRPRETPRYFIFLFFIWFIFFFFFLGFFFSVFFFKLKTVSCLPFDGMM